jgi:gas vesicle protein
MIFDKKQDRRCSQGNLARLFVVSFLVLLLGACASSSTVAPGKGTVQGMAVIPVEKAGLFGKPPADAMMFNEGVSWLGLSDKPADYAKAKGTFAILTQNYPQSKWRPLAETFVHLIDAIQSLQAEKLSSQNLTEKLKQDHERLKKSLQSERDSLAQENEKLKKDMELLKQLEVQLDQRGKMLR